MKHAGDPIVIGGTYELKYGEKTYVVLVLAECEVCTVRFKYNEPGWRLLILDSQGWIVETPSGSMHEWVKSAEIFRYGTRLA